MTNNDGLKPLGDCCLFIRNGANISQDSASGGIPITRIETISSGEINAKKVGYAGVNDTSKYSDYLLTHGDILMSHINSVAHLGKSSIYMGLPNPLIHGMNLLCMRPNQNIVLPKYLYYFTKSLTFKRQLPRITNKSVNQASFKVTDLKTKIMIPVVSLEEQKSIVNEIDRAESILRKRKESINLLDDYIRSVFLEMFGDPVQNTKDLQKKPLKDFGEIITGNTPSRKDEDNYSSKYIEWIKTDNIKENELYITEASEYLSEKGFSKARFVLPDAVLITCIAGSAKSIGRVAMTDRKVSFNQQINAIQPNEDISPVFLYWLIKLSKSYILSYATRGMKKIITKGALQNIIMIFPPTKLQNEFVKKAEMIHDLKKNMILQAEDLENQLQALMQKVFKSSSEHY